MKKEEHLHVKLTTERKKRMESAIKKAPAKLRIKNKTDLVEYLLDTFFETVGA